MAITKLAGVRDNPKKIKKADRLKEIEETIENHENSQLADELAKREGRRAIHQFEEDIEDWISINTIENRDACRLVEEYATIHKAMYDEVNDYKLMSGPREGSFEVGYGPAIEAGVPRRQIHVYVFALTHGSKVKSSSVHIHHINGNRFDNRPENLLALPSHIHGMLEHSRDNDIRAEVEEIVGRLIRESGKA